MSQSFLKNLEYLLKALPTLSDSEVFDAISLIKYYKKQKIHSSLSSRGKCFHCRKEISYAQPPSSSHIKEGDGWLAKKINDWKKPVKISVDSHELKIRSINQLSPSVASRYICRSCWESEIKPDAQKMLYKEIERARNNQEYARQKDLDILSGKQYSSPAKAFRLLQQSISVADIEKLRDMPYGGFLKSRYWEIVRKYVLYRQNEKCNLCSNTVYLQVHHTTYEHRGSEIYHLEDLIVLCRHCHAKHHDKLGSV